MVRSGTTRDGGPRDHASRRVLLAGASSEVADRLSLHLRTAGEGWGLHPVSSPESLPRVLAEPGWDALLVAVPHGPFGVPELCALLREHALDLPLVALVNPDEEEAGVAAMAAGARDFVTTDRLLRLVPLLERERAEARRRREEPDRRGEVSPALTRLEALLSATPAVHFAARLEDDRIRLTFLSENLRESFGIEPAAMIRDPELWRERIHPEDLPAMRAALDGRIAEGGGSVEYRLRDEEGRWRWVRLTFRVVEPKGEAPPEMLGSLLDITREREAERERERTERRYRVLFERSLDGIAITTLDGRFLEVNERLASIMNRTTPSEYAGINASDGYVDPSARERLLAAMKEGPVRNMPIRYRTHDGIERDTLVSAIPWEDEEGRTAGLITIIRDVTASLRAERELRESEARFRELAESIQDVFWITDAESGRIIYASPAFETIWGRSTAELLERPGLWMEAIVAEDRPRVEAAWRARHQGDLEFEYRIVRPDGEVRRIWDRAVAIRGEDGTLLRFVGVAEDVTERLEAVEEVARLHERFQALIEYASDAIFLMNPDGTVRYASPSAASLVGLTPEEAETRDALSFIHPEDLPRAQEALASVLDDPTRESRVLHRVVDPSGRVRYVESLARNLLHVPAVRGIVVNSRDVTERHELEQALRHSQKMEAVGRLAGGIAHDFNNLLTVIEGHASFLLDSLPPGSEPGEDAAEIRSAARRASALTHQLLAFGKRQIVQPRRLRLEAVVHEMERMLGRLIGDPFDLVVEVEEGSGTVRADPGQVEQVVLNLVLNARDAMPDGGRIEVRVGAARPLPAGLGGEAERAADRRYGSITVRDEGAGIDEGVRERIFEPFFTTKPEGTGLGLSTVFGIVEQSGGFLDLRSEPGKGTSVTVYLPEEAASAEAGA